MKIVFLGSGEFGLPTLRKLSEDHTITGVVTQPDRPAGRARHPTPTLIGAWTAEALPDVPLFKPENVNEPAVMDRIRALESDAWVIIAFGQKLSEPLIKDRFAVNLHASLLPRWRGAAPINHAILAGDSETGNTVITIANRMDAGRILARSRRAIHPTMTASELHDLLSEDGPPLIEQVLRQHADGALSHEMQDETAVTRAGKLKKEDGWVDFTDSAENCRRRVNGLSPWPGVGVQFRSEPLRLLRANAIEGISDEDPGSILDAESGLVACRGDALLQLLEVQPPGKRVMTWQDYAHGRHVRAGEKLIGGRAC